LVCGSAACLAKMKWSGQKRKRIFHCFEFAQFAQLVKYLVNWPGVSAGYPREGEPLTMHFCQTKMKRSGQAGFSNKEGFLRSKF
jgi:hypothetical protein